MRECGGGTAVGMISSDQPSSARHPPFWKDALRVVFAVCGLFGWLMDPSESCLMPGGVPSAGMRLKCLRSWPRAKGDVRSVSQIRGRRGDLLRRDHLSGLARAQRVVERTPGLSQRPWRDGHGGSLMGARGERGRREVADQDGRDVTRKSSEWLVFTSRRPLPAPPLRCGLVSTVPPGPFEGLPILDRQSTFLLL